MSNILSSLLAMVGGHESPSPPGHAAGAQIVQPRTGILEDMLALTREPAVTPVRGAAQLKHSQETNGMITTTYPTTAAPALGDSVVAASAHTAHSTTSTSAISALPTSAAPTKRKLGQFTDSNWNHRCSEEQMMCLMLVGVARTRAHAALARLLGMISGALAPSFSAA